MLLELTRLTKQEETKENLREIAFSEIRFWISRVAGKECFLEAWSHNEVG